MFHSDTHIPLKTTLLFLCFTEIQKNRIFPVASCRCFVFRWRLSAVDNALMVNRSLNKMLLFASHYYPALVQNLKIFSMHGYRV